VGELAEQIEFYSDVPLAGQKKRRAMEAMEKWETIYANCAGLDVHKKSVEACVRQLRADGSVEIQTQRWGTMTRDLQALRLWLESLGVQQVAMESTGVYWKPIYNLLEEHFEVWLVNPREVKQVPGRKTDARDCQWLAQLMQFGLLRASFIPPRWQRDLRDLTRQRTQWVEEQTRAVNRMHKVLEEANIKLGSVASDILGVSGRAMLWALIRGQEDTEQIAQLARGRLRAKLPELRLALEGRVREHHQFQLRLLMKQLQDLDELIIEVDRRIAELSRVWRQTLKRLDEIDGIDQTLAEVLLAEVGPTVENFPTADHLASWAGMCPGNDESAGRQRSGKTRQGSRWLRQALVQAAWGATHTKSYLAARFRRLAARRGRKRALVAVGHSILTIVYHLLQKDGNHYRDLGPDYLDQLHADRITRYLVKRLERLGHKVTLEPLAA
jgi:transposase